MSQGVRATIAVVALYALVLQAFLVGMLPTASAQTHGFAELCAPDQTEEGAPTKHDGRSCCTAACAPLAVPVPQTDSPTLAWPRRSSGPVLFAESAPPPARGPPLHAHSARGPPQT